MASLYGFIKRLYLVRVLSSNNFASRMYTVRYSILLICLQFFYPPAPEAPTECPLRFGVLGAAGIAPIALIYPVKNHPDAVVEAVAARDQGRADAFAKKYGIPRAYGGPDAYQSTWV